jgi:xylulokinase
MLIGYTGGKILWMRNHEPDLFARMSLMLNPKDYLRLRLTGEVASEVSDASGTGLFDVRTRAWATG